MFLLVPVSTTCVVRREHYLSRHRTRFEWRNTEHPTDEWIRIHIIPGDLLMIPAGIYHRFTLDEQDQVKAVRLFKVKDVSCYMLSRAFSNPYACISMIRNSPHTAVIKLPRQTYIARTTSPPSLLHLLRTPHTREF